MKKTYVRPAAVAETFVANDYCATCGKTSDGIYHFTCDAPAGTIYYYDAAGNAKKIGTYHPCGSTHDTADRSNFYEGFIDRPTDTGRKDFFGNPIMSRNGVEDPGEHCLVWRGDSGNNGHGTVSLSMGEIDVVRS